MYRIRSSGEVKSQGEIRKMYADTSLPASWNKETCEELGIDPILESPMPQVTRYQTATQNGIEQDSKGNWVWAWAVTDMTTEGIAYLNNQEADSVRNHRNTLLSGSDWTQLADAPVNKAEWATYRQALRDITTQEGFPWNVVWPTKPE
jgi:hypothetical protein